MKDDSESVFFFLYYYNNHNNDNIRTGKYTNKPTYLDLFSDGSLFMLMTNLSEDVFKILEAANSKTGKYEQKIIPGMHKHSANTWQLVLDG